MLLTEWDLEEAKEVWREEALEEGIERGREERDYQVARNALAKGASSEFVHEITGLDIEIIEKIKTGL